MTPLAPGSLLADRYEIVGVLGRGGMATVLLAQDTLRSERVALKVLHPHLAGDPSMQARLQREVRAAARVRHPSALVAHELHSADGHTFLTLPYHPGQTLAERIASEGPLGAEQVRTLGRQLAEALAQAHRSGVLHRDVNPNNVMVDDAGEGVLMDFGLARLHGGASGHTTGVLGTTGYAAPEALDGRRGDPRSDLYGLGATLYLALTGTGPFAADTPLGVVQRQLDDEPVPPSEQGVAVPSDLEGTVLALLARDPDRRPQAASVVAGLLAERRGPDALVPVHQPILPEGTWTVLVGETGDDRGRRQALRVARGLRPSTAGTDVELFLRGKFWGGVKGVLGIPEGLSPEQLLLRGLARTAALPDEALAAPEGMLEPRFRLVEAVSEDTARDLVKVAGQAGFKAKAFHVREPAPSGGLPGGGWAWALAALTIAGGVGLVFVHSLVAVVAVLGALLTVLLWGLFGRSAGEQRDPEWASALPLAFADLAAHLAPGHRVEATLVERVRTRLDRLAATLEAGVDDFTAAALASGRATLERLRADADALGADLARLDGQLSEALTDLRSDAELAWLSGRSDRLRTRQRAGEQVDPEELARLADTLADQADVSAVVEALQVRRTAATTRLLELAASAHRARQDLVRAVEEEEPAGPILARLARVQEELSEDEGRPGGQRQRQ